MIKNNSETTAQILELFPVSKHKVEVSYTGRRISSDGGLMLLREVENQPGLIDKMSQCI